MRRARLTASTAKYTGRDGTGAVPLLAHLGHDERMTVTDWLLDSDPAIRWQVLRDIADAPAETVAAERPRVATEGVGRPAAGPAGR